METLYDTDERMLRWSPPDREGDDYCVIIQQLQRCYASGEWTIKTIRLSPDEWIVLKAVFLMWQKGEHGEKKETSP